MQNRANKLMSVYEMRDAVECGTIDVCAFQHWMDRSDIGPYEILELMASAIVGNQLNIGALINMYVREHRVAVNLETVLVGDRYRLGLKECIYYSEFRRDCRRIHGVLSEPLDYERIPRDRYDWVNQLVESASSR